MLRFLPTLGTMYHQRFEGIVNVKSDIFLQILGDILCMMALAYCYSHGQGIEVDHEKSFNYHQKAAEMGMDIALFITLKLRDVYLFSIRLLLVLLYFCTTFVSFSCIC
jgi:hypothetical protein